jgi:diguanylate cyclase (GGDEF)-like protein
MPTDATESANGTVKDTLTTESGLSFNTAIAASADFHHLLSYHGEDAGLTGAERIEDAAHTPMGPGPGSRLLHAGSGSAQEPPATTSVARARLTRARLALLQAMIQRIDGRPVPELLLALLNPAWRNVLVHAHLHHGPEHDAWHGALDVFDQLHASLLHAAASSAAPVDDDSEALLERIAQGLASICFEPGLRGLLLCKLGAALICDSDGRRAPVRLVEVAAGTTPAIVGFANPDAEHELSIELGDPASTGSSIRESWSAALDHVSRLRAGARLVMADEQGRPLALRIASPGSSSSSFCLANGSGHMVLQVSMTELADGLHTGRIILLDDEDGGAQPAHDGVLQHMARRLAWQSAHDPLTQLLNRREFERQLASSMDSVADGTRQHALMYLDLDQFKVINTISGHGAGDALLKVIANRLRDGLGISGAWLARLGGDEFGVLIEDVDADGARQAAELALAMIRRERFVWEGRLHSVTASIGLVMLDDVVPDADTAMRYADAACYACKEGGRNRVLEYELGDRRIMHRQGVMEWVAQLDHAMAENRLALKVQRIAPLAAGAGIRAHYEVLLTLEEDLGELMPAGEFIQAAETYNRVTALDRWVVARVLSWMAAHREQIEKLGGLAINVSGHSINDETFIDFVIEQFKLTHVPTAKVCFEITESAAIANLDNAREFMNRVRLLGCRFALDDFGTGLASYAYLRNLPVDYVKIDGVFVRGMERNPGDLAVVRSINEIGHCMGKQIIAEYVESEQTLQRLREIGVDFVQGFGVERPCPLDSLAL